MLMQVLRDSAYMKVNNSFVVVSTITRMNPKSNHIDFKYRWFRHRVGK